MWPCREDRKAEVDYVLPAADFLALLVRLNHDLATVRMEDAMDDDEQTWMML